MPIVIRDETNLTLSKAHGKFNKQEINDLFKDQIPISPPSKQPVNYYPFSCDDSLPHIGIKVLRSIVHLTQKKGGEFADEDILKDSHPLWEKFDESHKKKMREKLNSIMRHSSFGKIKDYVKKTNNMYRVETRSFQALQDVCKQIVEELTKKQEEKTLQEFY